MFWPCCPRTDSSAKLFKKAITARNISNLGKTEWQAFIDLMSFYFPKLTALTVAARLAPLFKGPAAPSAILSFNAEPLFAALINANVATGRGMEGGDVLDLIVHATSNRKAGRVPYVFCHGLLPVPGTPVQVLSSVDKLVFSEAAYLALANSSFSWQSASFLRAAGENTIVFIGVSLTDPNMRRWLSWVHATRVAELTEAGDLAPTSTVHYWIKKAPGDAATKRWIESAVAHLGIRIIWVDQYADIAQTLGAMFS